MADRLAAPSREGRGWSAGRGEHHSYRRPPIRPPPEISHTALAIRLDANKPATPIKGLCRQSGDPLRAPGFPHSRHCAASHPTMDGIMAPFKRPVRRRGHQQVKSKGPPSYQYCTTHTPPTADRPSLPPHARNSKYLHSSDFQS